MVRKRYSVQKQQEQISRKQFEEYLEQHEWITGDIDPDLGEDIFVRIYEDQVSTCLSLYVQLKSVQAIADHQLKTGEIHYSFDIEDLIHWENQIPPVFLVIWDIQRKAGWWISAREAVAVLNQHKPNWESNKTATVHIPSTNTISPEGLQHIRLLLAEKFFPVIAKGKEFNIQTKFVFPSTPAGREKRYELERMFAAGDQIQLGSEYIAEIILPDWCTRLFGTRNFQAVVLTFGSSPSAEILPAQVEITAPGLEPVRVPYVEFQIIKQGSEEITLSNEQQNIPLRFRLTINSKMNSFNLNIKFDYAVLDGFSSLQLINFQKIFAMGGKIRMTMLKTGEFGEFIIPAGSFPLPDPRVAQCFENIAAIQHKTGRVIQFPQSGSLTSKEMNNAAELKSIVTTGRYVQKATSFTLDILKEGIALILKDFPHNCRLFFKQYADESYLDLFSERFDLGPVTQTTLGRLRQSYEELSAWYEKANDDDSITLQLIEPEITDEYQKWQPVNG